VKKIEPIRFRNNNKASSYYLGKKMTEILDIGKFPALLQKMWDYKGEVQSTYKLIAITADFVYYADEEESDDTVSVVMLTRKLKLVSDNFFASNDLAQLVQKNEGLLWISDAVKRWQMEEFVKQGLITPELKNILEEVDIAKLTEKEKAIYFAYLYNGPATYSKPESLMAVMSNDVDQVKFSDQLTAIMKFLPQE
jgi:hypothetical protein